VSDERVKIHCAYDELVSVIALVPHPRNPNQHPEKQIELLSKIIEHQGWRAPITVSTRSGFMIRGHGRLMAAKHLGLTHVPVDMQDYQTEAEEWADLIADNRIAELAETENSLLASLLREIDDGSFDMDLTGFDEKELASLMARLEAGDAKDDDFDVDAAVEEIEVPVTQPGDIWTLGKHRVMCGDSTDSGAVALLMAGQKADMIFTDPPYNVDYGANKHHPSWNIRAIAGDKQSAGEWETFCKSLYAVFKEFCTGDVYMWGASGPEGMRMRLWLIDAGCHWSTTIIWKKNQLVLSPAKYQRMYEPCFYGWFGKSSFAADRKQTEVWEFDRPRVSKLHPTMKPIELCGYGVENSSLPGQIILDLFGGSGSTLIACEQVGRTCMMMELDPKYVDVIVRRWEELTGQKAVLLDA